MGLDSKVAARQLRILIAGNWNSKFVARRLGIRSYGAGFEVRSSEIRSLQLGGSGFIFRGTGNRSWQLGGVVARLNLKFAARQQLRGWIRSSQLGSSGFLLRGAGSSRFAARRLGIRSWGGRSELRSSEI